MNNIDFDAIDLTRKKLRSLSRRDSTITLPKRGSM